MADAWPASQALCLVKGDSSWFDWLLSLLIVTPLQPLFGIDLVFCNMFVTLRIRKILSISTNPELGPDTMSMSNKLRRIIGDVFVTFFGINQPRGFLKSTAIVANTYIVVGMSDSTKLPPTHIDTDEVKEDNMAYALTLGHKAAENSCLIELNEAGKLALLESTILPNYKQLRFLDGRSGIATLIIGVQAIGYVASIVYRAIHHLPVSPIEAIGFAFSMLVVVHSLVHNVGVICQNPLVIYLNSSQEQEMFDKCKSIRWSDVDSVKCYKAGTLGTVVVGSVVVAFTILVEWHMFRKSWLDAIGPILFLLSLIIQSLCMIRYTYVVSKWRFLAISSGCVIISFRWDSCIHCDHHTKLAEQQI